MTKENQCVAMCEHLARIVAMVRIDHNVLEWLRTQGPGYQTRTNAVLRAYTERTRG